MKILALEKESKWEGGIFFKGNLNFSSHLGLDVYLDVDGVNFSAFFKNQFDNSCEQHNYE